MLQTKIHSAEETFESRHARMSGLNKENREISIEQLIEMSKNAGMPLLNHFKTVGDLINADAKTIQSIEYMGAKKLGMIYDSLERLLSNQTNETPVEDQTKVELKLIKNDSSPVSKSSKKPIVITQSAADLLEALYLGCDVEVEETSAGTFEPRIYVRYIAPEIDAHGNEIGRMVIGSAEIAPKPKKGHSVDMERSERADKWRGKKSITVAYEDSAMLIRAGLVDIEDNALVMMDDGFAFCSKHFGEAVDYTHDEVFTYEPDLEEGEEYPEVQIGENPDFEVHHVVLTTDRLTISAKDEKLLFTFPGKKSYKSRLVELPVADTLARFFNRARKAEEDCGISFDGISGVVEDGEIKLIFDAQYPDPFVKAIITMNASNAASLADHLLLIADGEDVSMTLLHIDGKIVDDYAMEPDSLRI